MWIELNNSQDLTKDATMLQALLEARAKRRAATAASWTIRTSVGNPADFGY
jgi:hypothetical protein